MGSVRSLPCGTASRSPNSASCFISLCSWNRRHLCLRDRLAGIAAVVTPPPSRRHVVRLSSSSEYAASRNQHEAVPLVASSRNGAHRTSTSGFQRALHRAALQEVCRSTPYRRGQHQPCASKHYDHTSGATDNRPAATQRRYCGFSAEGLQSPLPSQTRTFSRLRWALQNKKRCPLRGSHDNRSRTKPYSPSNPLRMSVTPAAR
jgi:hypothetical protein